MSAHIVESESREPDERDALLRLEADLDAEGRFGERVLVVWNDRIEVTSPSGAVLSRIEVADIVEARNEPLVGGGRLLVVTRTGTVQPIVSYSLRHADDFARAARGIERLAHGEAFQVETSQDKVRCPKCGRLLPEKDGVCPACLRRGKTLLRVLAYLKPYKRTAALLALVALGSTALNLAPPYIQGTLVDNVLAPKTNLSMLGGLMLGWLAILIAAVALQIYTGRLVAYLGASIAADLRSSVYRAVEMLRLTYFDKKQVGAIASRVTTDTDRVWFFLVEGVPFLLINGLLVVGIIGFLFATNPLLAAAILAPLPVVVGISVRFWKPLSQLFHRVGQKWARLHIQLNESISGIRVVKAFAQEDVEFAKFQGRNGELRDAGVEADIRWYTAFGMMSFLTSLGLLIHWMYGGTMVYRGDLTLGDFWKIHAYLMLVYGPLQWFAQVNNWFSRAMAGADRIFEVIDNEREAYADKNEPSPIEGRVTFEGVRFGYDKSNPVLKGLTFDVAKGEMIGLVGKSGAGKSTTINLLCRFYEPDEGSIRIDGRDYREIPLQELRRQIGVVLQEPFLFNGTIAENIAYGRPGASFEEVMEAARAANAHEFILGKPDGYDTMAGERGAKLSGGERQRIAIARAILHDPRILILDEATSSVDVETEKQIQEAIQRLIEGRTTFAIAHRLSTLRNASRLIVLEKGEIVEIGTHAELMERKGVFHDLVHTQSQVNEIIGVGVV